MDFTIREARKEDCTAMMQLVKELAVYERAPEAVTVDFEHFVESGFGSRPVWWAFVATQSLDTSRGTTAELSRYPRPEEAMSGADELVMENEIGAISNETIVGFALYYIRYSTWKGQRMYLEDLVVTESMRGQGIGTMLFDQLIEEAKEKKFTGMMWQVLEWNEPAIRFYEKKYNAKIDKEWFNCSIEF